MAKLAAQLVCLHCYLAVSKLPGHRLEWDTSIVLHSSYLTKTSQASPGHGQREKANSDVKLFVRVKCGLAPPVCCFHPNDSCDNSNLFFQARADEWWIELVGREEMYGLARPRALRSPTAELDKVGMEYISDFSTKALFWRCLSSGVPRGNVLPSLSIMLSPITHPKSHNHMAASRTAQSI